MKKDETQIDKLTRDLMQGTALAPSSSLMDRIMGRVMNEKKASQKGYLGKMPSLGTLLGGLAVYLLIIAGIFYLLKTDPGAGSSVLEGIKNIFPLLLTVGTGISFFFLFTQLDNWMKSKEQEVE